jgi:hypothetical protein
MENNLNGKNFYRADNLAFDWLTEYWPAPRTTGYTAGAVQPGLDNEQQCVPISVS